MDFGLFNQFNIREGADYHATLKEWLDLAVESEKLGMDSFWFGETRHGFLLVRRNSFPA